MTSSSHHRRPRPVVLLFAALPLAAAFAPGCGAPDAPPVDATGPDAPTGTDAGERDGGRGGLDAAGGCTGASDCDDAVFCNGAERCAPGDALADARGCAPSAGAACMPMQTCDEDADECLTECDLEPDADGDGSDAMACGGTDCDDANPRRAPGRPELCDAADEDEDCDGTTFGFRDLDGDAYPDASCCNTSDTGATTCGTDCVDTRPDIHPSLAETCDGSDNDCDSSTDEGVLRTFYVDGDGDSFGNELMATMQACTPPAGHTEMGRDCDDARADVSPVSPEICDVAGADENCDGTPNPASLCSCAGDISRGCALPGRCAAGTQRCVGGSWGACSITAIAEICNGEDDDCDGRSDETTTVRCYRDLDGDEAPAGAALEEDVCPVAGRGAVGGCPLGLTDVAPVAGSIDCDDDESLSHPGATETCDAARLDENCDGLANPDPPCACSGVETRGCTLPGRCSAGAETCAAGAWGVCSISPATETCNDVDDDCDGVVDDGVTITCYPDTDDDGFSPGGAPSAECPVGGRGAVGGCPFGLTNLAPVSIATTDCDDAMRPDVSPLGVEVCDAARRDENCDGVANPDPPCACSGLETRACPLSGRCAAGIQTCNTGAWGACSISAQPESCNLADDDCDGLVDEGVTVRCYADADNDTFSPSGSPAQDVCEVLGRAAVGGCPVGLTNRPATNPTSTDCNDTNPGGSGIFPGAPESCTGAVDDDCDGTTNEGCACTIGDPTRPCQRLGVCAGGTETCAGAPAGWVCDRSPGAESCNRQDDDCDGSIDEGTTTECWTDADGDTYASAGASSFFDCSCPAGTTDRDPALAGQADCDDGFALRSPAVSETCNLVDDDCDGAIDDGLFVTTVYVDTDGDTRRGTAAMRCRLASDTIASEDCDETRLDTYVAAPELCDRWDNNCSSGGGLDASEDVDSDGHASTSNACSGGTLPKDDCDDTLASVYLDAPELCDRRDTNCRQGGGAVATEDFDSDMHAPWSGAGCTGGYPTDDCNDAASDIYSGAPERCDRRDNDCSSGGGADPSEDADLDTRAPWTAVCFGGYPLTDCDDSVATTYQGAPELCNRVDDDCSSGGGSVSAEDADGDLHAPPTAFCLGGPYPKDDCDDAVATTHPGAIEACNRIDDNCSSGGGPTAGEDDDGDLHSPIGAACSFGYPRDDCDDSSFTVRPGATETCNGVDDDCDTVIDDGVLTTYYRDDDGDSFGVAPTLACMIPVGYANDGDDCDDTDSSIFPGGTESCDGADNDCDGNVDEGVLVTYYRDNDGDSYGGTVSMDSCSAPAGYVAIGADCLDTNASIYPGADEYCDNTDQDCSGLDRNGCPSDTNTAAPPTYLAYQGIPTGTAFGPDLCSGAAMGELLIGFDIWYSNNAADDPGIQGLRPVCTLASIAETPSGAAFVYDLTSGSARLGATRGNTTHTMAALRCPADQFVQGWSGRADPSAGLMAIGLYCGGLEWDGGPTGGPVPLTLSTSSTMSFIPTGYSGGTFFSDSCDSWSRVGEIRGRMHADGDVGALSLGCSTIGYVPQ